jgi:2-C-methyl-D-erythritol 2,4-cyclodiphosphate synthase
LQVGFRIGFGTDLHRLKKGGGIRLGGVDIPCQFAVEAASDGDVLLHALTDALLGALALGDIGEHFPADRTAPGDDSRRFLRYALDRAARAGAKVVNADCVVELERPSLKDWKGAMRRSLAEILGLPEGRVGVKAKTAEGLGPVGEGLAVAAQAAALIEMED